MTSEIIVGAAHTITPQAWMEETEKVSFKLARESGLCPVSVEFNDINHCMFTVPTDLWISPDMLNKVKQGLSKVDLSHIFGEFELDPDAEYMVESSDHTVYTLVIDNDATHASQQ